MPRNVMGMKEEIHRRKSKVRDRLKTSHLISSTLHIGPVISYFLQRGINSMYV
jgi:hypothetical protein